VVEPAHRTLTAYVRFGEVFGDGTLYHSHSEVASVVLEGFSLYLAEVFASIGP